MNTSQFEQQQPTPHGDPTDFVYGQDDGPTTMREQGFAVGERPRIKLTAATSDVEVRVEPTDRIFVRVTSDGADLAPVALRQNGDTVAVDIPRLLSPEGRGFSFSLGSFSFSAGNRVEISTQIVAPEGVELDLETKSGDLTVTGAAGAVRLRTHSGDIAVDQVDDGELTTSSGDIQVQRGGQLKLRTGSGDIGVKQIATGDISTGSGDLTIGLVDVDATLGTGSGDVNVGTVGGSIGVRTGSGDVRLERVGGEVVEVRTGAGDVTVGVPRGKSVYQDLSSVVGEARSQLESLGAPAEGQPYVSVRVSTAAGDIRLVHCD